MSDASPTRRHLLLAAGAAALTGAAACSRTTDDGAGAPTVTAGTSAGSPSAGSAASPAPGSAAGAAPGGASTSASRSASGAASPVAGPDISRATSGRPEVALTFHGTGDLAILRRMLAEFANAGAHVTVLAIGTWLAAEPQVAKLVLDGGHDLGNHTWSHQPMTALSAAAIRTEVERAAQELRRLTGSAGRWFRPSGTPTSTPAIRQAAVNAGYGACLGYDVDPLDYTDPGPDAIVRAFQTMVRAGSIVSLHLGHQGTLTAMPRLLATLADRELTAVTATHLLGNS
ncbi:MAG TPA: polysaccharide deacetylase family protein [Kineosporiaceae bacterium]